MSVRYTRCTKAKAFAALALFCAIALGGCAHSPTGVLEESVRQTAPARTGDEIALRALAMIGAPYRFGGSGPDAFDCSGLVHYIYGGLGLSVPRTAAEQYATAQRVRAHDLVPGDLLFFRIKGRISHVAIYAGEGRFVHAPQTGRAVELRPLDDPFYAPRMVGVGRFTE